MAGKDLDLCTSPERKLLSFFKKSRDNWKQKHLHFKHQYKLMQNQVRAVQKSRDAWRQKAQEAQRQLRELQQLHKLEQKKRQPHT